MRRKLFLAIVLCAFSSFLAYNRRSQFLLKRVTRLFNDKQTSTDPLAGFSLLKKTSPTNSNSSPPKASSSASAKTAPKTKPSLLSFFGGSGEDFFDSDPKTLNPKPAAAKTIPTSSTTSTNKSPVKSAPIVSKAFPKAAAPITTIAQPAVVPPSIVKPKPATASAPDSAGTKTTTTTVKMPNPKSFFASPGTTTTPKPASSSSAGATPQKKVTAIAPSIPQSISSKDSAEPMNITSLLPEFLQSTLAPVVDTYNDIIAIPSKIDAKTQETIKSIKETQDTIASIPNKIEKKKREVRGGIDQSIETAKYVASLPGKVADTIDAFASGRDLSPSVWAKAPSKLEQFVENPDVVKSGAKSKGVNFEDIKEGIYRIGDAIEGTANLIQATGKGAVSTAKAVQRLPSEIEKLSKTTADKIDDTKAGIEAFQSTIKETAASVVAFGESVVSLPETVEKKIIETKKSVEDIKGKVAGVKDIVETTTLRLQGKAPPPKPTKPKPLNDFDRAVRAITEVGKTGFWVITKGVEFVNWATEKRDTQQKETPAANPSPIFEPNSSMVSTKEETKSPAARAFGVEPVRSVPTSVSAPPSDVATAPSSEKPSLEKPSSEKPSSEKLSSQKPSSEKLSSEKQSPAVSSSAKSVYVVPDIKPPPKSYSPYKRVSESSKRPNNDSSL